MTIYLQRCWVFSFTSMGIYFLRYILECGVWGTLNCTVLLLLLLIIASAATRTFFNNWCRRCAKITFKHFRNSFMGSYGLISNLPCLPVTGGGAFHAPGIRLNINLLVHNMAPFVHPWLCCQRTVQTVLSWAFCGQVTLQSMPCHV